MSRPPASTAGAALAPSGAPLRVDSLDLVRGVCALAVGVFHVHEWLDVPHAQTPGFYGVYAFFVISGASLVLGYARRMNGPLALQKFLLARYARLLPLFLLVCLYELVLGEYRDSTLRALAPKLFLNATFLFGFANPGTTSLVTGGWSLGVEFTFYFVFPVLLAALSRPRLGIVVLAGCLLAQHLFIADTLDGVSAKRLARAWAAYTQPAAFIAYFAFGCAFGWWRLQRPQGASALASLGWSLACALLLAIVFHVPQEGALDVLVGTKGILLSLATIASVACAAFVTLSGWARRIARVFGDFSYGAYLLHPLIYRVLAARIPRETMAEAPLQWTAVVLVSAVVCALVAKRLLEDPVLRAARKLIDRLGPSAREQPADGSLASRS